MLRRHCFTPIIHSIAPQLHSSPAVTQFHLGSPMVSSVRVSPLDPVEKDSVKAVKALEVEED